MNLEKKYREVRDQSEHTLWGDLVCVVAIGLSASMQLIFFFFFYRFIYQFLSLKCLCKTCRTHGPCFKSINKFEFSRKAMHHIKCMKCILIGVTNKLPTFLQWDLNLNAVNGLYSLKTTLSSLFVFHASRNIELSITSICCELNLPLKC